jgi:hypothetical protein
MGLTDINIEFNRNKSISSHRDNSENFHVGVVKQN